MDIPLVPKASQRQCIACISSVGSKNLVKKTRNNNNTIKQQKNIGKKKAVEIARIYNIFATDKQKLCIDCYQKSVSELKIPSKPELNAPVYEIFSYYRQLTNNPMKKHFHIKNKTNSECEIATGIHLL